MPAPLKGIPERFVLLHRMPIVTGETQEYASTLAQHLALSPPLHPLAIVVTDEDTYWAAAGGIHSLAIATRYGHHPVTCVSRPVAPLLRESPGVTQGRWLPERGAVAWSVGARELIYEYHRSEKRPGALQVWSVNPSEVGIAS